MLNKLINLINPHQNINRWFIGLALWLLINPFTNALIAWIDEKIGITTQVVTNTLIYAWQYGIPLVLLVFGILLLIQSRLNQQNIGRLKTSEEIPARLLENIKEIENKQKKTALQLIESFPVDGQGITFDELRRMYLRFNNPIDQETGRQISNFYVRSNTVCQWDICGWIQYAEDGKKLIWHPHEHHLVDHKDNYYKADGLDYHHFEIRIGTGSKDDGVRLKDIYGNEIQKTVIRVFMK